MIVCARKHERREEDLMGFDSGAEREREAGVIHDVLIDASSVAVSLFC